MTVPPARDDASATMPGTQYRAASQTVVDGRRPVVHASMKSTARNWCEP
jgi:hypothetical protein